MDANKKSSAKCGDVLHKGSSALSFISMLLIVALFLRMESINRKTEMNDLRISKVEKRIEVESPQTTDHKDEMETPENAQNAVEAHHQKNRRDVAQTQNAPTISLKQIRKVIDKKLTQVCTTKGKICQVGPQGPPGDRGAHGYPGYKGEKGAPGIPGPQGPLGPTGAQGPTGKRGPQGARGIKGEMGEEGPAGSPGMKGNVGPMGRPGIKGSIGLKGSKGNKGFIGVQGPKGECIISPKINVFPMSLDVFINTSATFYCWVDGQTSKKITWSKLGGALLKYISVEDSVLRINNVRRSHVGSYICTAYTSHGILKTISVLRIKEPPVITNRPPSQVSVVQGSTLSLCCEATGSPPPSVRWLRADRSSDLTLAFQENGCLKFNMVRYNGDGDYICRATNRYGLAETTTRVTINMKDIPSCEEALMIADQKLPDAEYLIRNGKLSLAVYCDMISDGKGWALVARFSNNDDKNWMKDSGHWWYDQRVAMGATTSPFINTDMISPAFWLISGSEIKITRSDDPSHTPLLPTTGNCLAGQTFRSKITSYGDFRNGKVWASNQCLGSCTVQYSGQYKSTDGFQQAECSGNIQSANKIGFWCDWDAGDGSVMMIGGGGGSTCSRADHGIGITEANAASFVDLGTTESEYDFGYNAKTGNAPSQAYSLNLWIR